MGETAYRILVVCAGNICRSPTAEAVLRQRLAGSPLAGRVEVDSAGYGAWHAGQPPDPRAVEAWERAGYRLERVARRMTPEDFARFDLVLAVDDEVYDEVLGIADGPEERAKVAMLRSFDPAAPPGASVPDPYYGGRRGFVEVLTIIESAVDGLLAHLEQAGR